MSNKDLKKVLIDSLKMESELYDFCIECLKHIYNDEAEARDAILAFDEGIENVDHYGCIQSLSCIIANKEREENIRKKAGTSDERA